MKFLDIYNQDKKLHAGIIKDLKLLFKSTDYILGSYVENFEKKFAKYCNVKYAVGCANGTDAIYLALKSLNLKKNSEVIMPAMTYCSTIFSVIRAGLKPVLVDIENNSSVISIEGIKSKITKNTKVILLVHLYGQSCHFDKLIKALNKRKIFIIEDASQAHGAFDHSSGKKGKKVGSQGDLACFSLYPGKNLGAYGDAGIITTNDKKKYNYLKKLRNLGSQKKYFHDIVGVNSRLDTIQALILSKKLNNLDKYNHNRKKIANIYEKNISNIRIKKLKYSVGCVFHQYVLIPKNIKNFSKYLAEKKIPFGRHYPFPIHKLKAVKNLFLKQKYPNSEKLAKNGISIPIDPLMKQKDVLFVCKTINNFR
jgi:dTDP-4-amino-4,6-dideoxygalactose transaminase